MKYRVKVNLEGYIELEADSEDEALAYAEDGFSRDLFECESAEIGEVEEVE